jgi:hypothetical protein
MLLFKPQKTLRITIITIYTVTLSGFTSTKASIINNHKGGYHEEAVSSSRYESAERIIPAAPYWGDFRREGCTVWGRLYSSILWGVEWGQSWEAACRSTPAYITTTDGSRVTAYAKWCDNQGLNMWGIFYVSEPSCGGEPPA